ncbi:MAG: hypothetical protein ACJ79H_00315 [Myxococcales bacterium]
MNRLKLSFALGATVAVLANQACNSSAPTAAKQSSSTSTITPIEPKSLRIDLYPAAMPGEQFPVDVSVRDDAGNLLDVSDTITLALSANPTATTLQGTTSMNAVHGVASFTNLVIPVAGQGYSLTASSPNDQSAPPASFDVTWSQDDQQTAGLSPNNSTASAQLISPKVPIFGTLGPGEVHYYRFRAKLGQVLSVASVANRIDQGNWDTSLRLRLIAPDGVTEIQRSGAINADSRRVDNDILLLRVPKDGDYYLVCDADQPGFLSGKFGVAIGFVASQTPQIETEPWGATGQNDTIATAQALAPGLLAGHYDYTAANPAASDFYKISLTGPARIHLEVYASRNGAAYGDLTWSPRLELQDSTGAVLAANETTYFLDPAIDYIVTTAGTYYVRVTRSAAAGNTGSSPYFLSYQPSAYAPVAQTAGNTSTATAMAIKYGADVAGSFTAAGDQYFAFGGTAGDVVRLVVQDRTQLQGASFTMNPGTSTTSTTTGATTPSPAPQGDAVLLAADGTALSSGAQFASTTESKYNVRQTILQATATYFVRVRSTAAGRFGLRVELVAGSAREVEPNDSTAQATAIGANTWISGTVGKAGDTDHFKIHAETRQLVTVSLYAAPGGGIGTQLSDWGSGLVPNLEVRDPSGTLLSYTSADRKGESNFAEAVDRVGPMIETSFRAAVAGDYEIVVSDADGQGGPNYFYALQLWKNK